MRSLCRRTHLDLARHKSKDKEGLTATHVYLFGVVILAVMASILITQRADMLRLGHNIVELERQKSELFELQRKLHSKVESCRSVTSLEQALQQLGIELEPRPVNTGLTKSENVPR